MLSALQTLLGQSSRCSCHLARKGLPAVGDVCTHVWTLSCLSRAHCMLLCCSVAAERHQGKPARKRKRDEDAAEDDAASSDEEAEIGEGSD